MKKSLISASTICFLLAAACHKESSTTYSSTDDFFNRNQSVSQKFSFANNAGAVIQTSRGTKIHFPANGFVDAGNTLISGQVNIEVKEILTPGEMILNNITAMSFTQPLESGGEYFIGATANNQEVKLAAGKKIQIELPSLGINMDNMKVFTGYTWGADTLFAAPRQTWGVSTDAANVVVLTSVNVYSMFCDSIKWINCDRLLGGTSVYCKVTPGNSPSVDDTRVYVHFTGRNSVISLYRFIGTDYFTAGLIAAPVTIVGICIKNGKLYASVTTANLQDTKSYPLNFSPTNENTLKATLSALK